MLNLERLRALHAVADRGSVNAAAQALHVTTSAISQQLAKLEQEIGQPLLERNGRGVRLTDAAAVLVAPHRARAVAARAGGGRARRAPHRRGRSPHHRGVPHRRTRARAARPAARCSPLTRSSTWSVREQEPHESHARCWLRGDLDLLIAQDWANAPLALPDGLSRAPILDDVADVALPATHPLAGREAVALDELAGDRWIAWQVGHHLSRLAHAHAAVARARAARRAHRRRARDPAGAGRRRAWAPRSFRVSVATRCQPAFASSRSSRRCAGTSTRSGAARPAAARRSPRRSRRSRRRRLRSRPPRLSRDPARRPPAVAFRVRGARPIPGPTPPCDRDAGGRPRVACG